MTVGLKMLNLMFMMSLIVSVSSLDTLESRVNLTVEEAIFKYLPSCASCEGKCGTKMSSDEPKRGCSCDELCISYKDCCPDYVRHCPTDAAHEHSGFIPVLTPDCTIVPVSMYSSKPYLLVDSCKHNRSACTTTRDSPQEFIPVWDALRKVHFVNFNCAVCNGATKLTPWQSKLTCHRSRVQVRQDISETMKKEELNKLWKQCTVTMTPDPKVMDNPRTCVPHGFIPPKSCGNLCFRTHFEDICKHNRNISYINVYTKAGKIHFKSFYKFICSQFEPLAPDALNCDVDFHIETGGFHVPGYFSFKLLFDVDIQNGFVVGQNRIPECLEGEIWSRDERKCRKSYDDTLYNQSLSKINLVLELEDEDLVQTILDKSHEIYLSHVQGTAAYLVKPKLVAYTLYVTNQTSVSQKELEGTIATMLRGKRFRMFYLNDTEIKCKGQEAIHVYDKTEFEFVIPNSIRIIKTNRTVSEFKIISNFSVAVCGVSISFNSFSASSMGIVTIVFTSLSIIALSIRLLLHCLLADGGPARLQISLVTSLLVAMVAFLLNPFFLHLFSVCYVIAVLIHWSFLAAFCWIAVIGWDILHMLNLASNLRRTEQGNRMFLFYSLYGWGFPTMTVVTSLVLDNTGFSSSWTPAYAVSLCWISNKLGLLVYFVAPVALQIFVSIIFFVGCIFYLYRNKMSRGNNNQERGRFWIHIRLFILMGLTWVIGFVAIPLNYDALWYIFIVLNASQGIFLLLVYLLTKRTRRHLLEKYRNSWKSRQTLEETTFTSLVTSKTKTDEM